MKKFLLLFIICQLHLSDVFGIYGNPPDVSEIKRFSPNRIESSAKRFYRAEDFTNAYYYYLALSQVRAQVSTDVSYRLGKSALYVGDYQTAVYHLNKARVKANRYPLVIFEYANALKFNGQYEKAIEFFNQYISSHKPTHKEYAAFAKEHIQGCQKSIRDLQIQAITEDEGELVEMQGQIRSVTTLGKHGYRLAEYQDARGISIQVINDQYQLMPMASSASNPLLRASAPNIAPDGETVYFMRPERNAQGDLEYRIYTSQLDINGNLINVKKMGSGINRAGYSSMYPTAGYDKEGNEVLYFTSTLPGGNGGYDIWYATKLSNGEFSHAYHLGMRVNSPADEITPFYYQTAGELYFSSNKPQGMGGFDVYRITGVATSWEEDAPILLPSPINSRGNDYFYRQDAATNQTFLTTDRLGKDANVKFTNPIRASVMPSSFE